MDWGFDWVWWVRGFTHITTLTASGKELESRKRFDIFSTINPTILTLWKIITQANVDVFPQITKSVFTGVVSKLEEAPDNLIDQITMITRIGPDYNDYMNK